MSAILYLIYYCVHTHAQDQEVELINGLYTLKVVAGAIMKVTVWKEARQFWELPSSGTRLHPLKDWYQPVVRQIPTSTTGIWLTSSIAMVLHILETCETICMEPSHLIYIATI